MIKVVALDDHSLFRIGLVAVLEGEPDIAVVGEHGQFATLKPLLPTLDADVLLVDISLGRESGLDIARFAKEINPRLKVIMLSMHKEEFYIVNALDAGVDGYVHKDADLSELVLGIRKVANGEKYFSPEISSLLVNSVYSKPSRGFPFLTAKEKEVVNHLIEGLSNKEIAAQLNVSPRTIETHRGNILNKLGLRNTAELIKKIAEQKIRF